MTKETKATLEAENLDVVAYRGYFSSEEILACEKAGITVTLPKPMTSNSNPAYTLTLNSARRDSASNGPSA